MRWDGVLKPGNEVEKIAAHIDILPTFADIAGIDKLRTSRLKVVA